MVVEMVVRKYTTLQQRQRCLGMYTYPHDEGVGFATRTFKSTRTFETLAAKAARV